MHNEPWVVKTRSGKIWGKICRVVIDSASRQIVCVDVLLGGTDRFARVPWKSLELENDDIVLSTSEGEVQSIARPTGARVPDTVTLEETSPTCHCSER